MVLKNSDPAYLLECLEKVSVGARWIDPELGERAKELAETLGDREAHALSPRERQLISLVRKGLRNRDVAEQLGVTEGTIKVYLHALFEKLGVSSRTEHALRADEFLTGSFLKS
jgi:two-component system nitrate/nitrite response regulator NarP